MSRAASNETPQDITRRWILRFAVLFVLCIVVAIAAFVVWRVRLSRNIKNTLASIHADGYPVSLVELEEKYYPPIAKDQNAATFFLEIFDRLQITNVTRGSIPDLPEYQSPKKSEFFSGQKLQLINRLLATNHGTLDRLRQIPTATNCRYPITLSQGYQTLLPHLSRIGSAASLLSSRAVFEVQNGDTAGSVDDLNAILRLCHSLDREPVMISQLSRMGRANLSVKSLEYMLNAQQFSDTQLAALFQAYRELKNPQDIERGFATEICNARDFFEMSGAQMHELGRKSEPADPDETPPPAAALNRGFAVVRMTGFFERDFLFLLRTMQEHLQDARLPFPERLDAGVKLQKHVEDETSHHYYIFSSLMLPSLDRLELSEAGFIAHINIAQTALAIERYRLANENRLPEKLADLIPSFLPAELMDPFDGKPIRYKKLTKGYMVYSVGRDRKDDGGVYAYQPKVGAPADITFVAER